MPVLNNFNGSKLNFRGLIFDVAGTISMKIDGAFQPIRGATELVSAAQRLLIPRVAVSTSNRILLEKNLADIGFSEALSPELIVPDADKTTGRGFLTGLELLNERFQTSLIAGDVLVFEDDPHYARRAFELGFAVCWIGLRGEELTLSPERFLRVELNALDKLQISE